MFKEINKLDSFWDALVKLGKEYKEAVYAWSYSNHRPMQKLVDEEGCGAVFATFIEGNYKECR